MRAGRPMLDDFMVRAGLAGVGVALAAGPLGCFMVWRRMAYFGDATAHAALLGVALALATDIDVLPGILLAALAMAFTVTALSGRKLAHDTLLGVAAHTGLALGLLAVALTGRRNIDLDAYLFGEILAVNRGDLMVIWGGGALVIALLVWRWSALLASTLSGELAAASGIDAGRERVVLTVCLAVLIAIAIKVVGALLITALLIIPAAGARGVSRTPEAMAVLAAGFGVFAALGGLQAAMWWDLPAGPAIVAVAAACFGVATLAGGLRR